MAAELLLSPPCFGGVGRVGVGLREVEAELAEVEVGLGRADVGRADSDGGRRAGTDPGGDPAPFFCNQRINTGSSPSSTGCGPAR